MGSGIVMMKCDAINFVVFYNFIDDFLQTNFCIPFSVKLFSSFKEMIPICPVRPKKLTIIYNIENVSMNEQLL